MTKKRKGVDYMTTSCAMLQTLKNIQKSGISKEDNKKILKDSGIITKKGDVAKKYKDIIVVKVK